MTHQQPAAGDALQAQGVVFAYPTGGLALDGVDFRLAGGEFVALLASNGSGKTTLLKVLVGLLKPKSGTVQLWGRDLGSMKQGEVYRQVGMVLQNPTDQLFAATVEEDVAFGPRNLGLSDAQVEERVVESLSLVGALQLRSRAIHHISFGEQKRVAIAGVLAMGPSVILLDEPTAGLDPAGEAEIMRVLSRLNKERGISVLLATHLVDMLPLFADRIYVLNRGTVLHQGPPEVIFRDDEILKTAHLRLPYISGLLYELKKYDGVPIDGLPLTIGEAREKLLELIPDSVTVDGVGTGGRMRELRGGFSTGACAAAAAKAAALLLRGEAGLTEVAIPFPDGTRETFALEVAELLGAGVARAAVRKSAGDDPDVTDKALIVAQVRETAGEGIVFRAGEGVGTVTKPGLSIPPGEPAINPGPRRMIAAALREVAPVGYEVTISIPGGTELAQRTFNPRLGIAGGVSILGTTGRVVPFSCPALREALACALDIAQAAGERAPVLVPGKIGKSAAERHFALRPGQVVEVSNEWGYMLEKTVGRGFEALLLVGHPGKLAKLAMGYWDTHSRSSPSASGYVHGIAASLLGAAPASETVEGVLETLAPADRRAVAERVAEQVARSAAARLECGLVPAVVLIDMKGEILGSWGDLSRWTSA